MSTTDLTHRLAFLQPADLSLQSQHRRARSHRVKSGPRLFSLQETGTSSCARALRSWRCACPRTDHSASSRCRSRSQCHLQNWIQTRKMSMAGKTAGSAPVSPRLLHCPQVCIRRERYMCQDHVPSINPISRRYSSAPQPCFLFDLVCTSVALCAAWMCMTRPRRSASARASSRRLGLHVSVACAPMLPAHLPLAVPLTMPE